MPVKQIQPPVALAGCAVEHYVARDRSTRHLGNTTFFGGDGKPVKPVPLLAICRAEDRGFLLLHCDRRWSIVGIQDGFKTVRDAKKGAATFYSGLSRLWIRTGVKKRDVKRYLQSIGHYRRCSFCGQEWHQVKRLVTNKNETATICDGCITKFRRGLRS